MWFVVHWIGLHWMYELDWGDEVGRFIQGI